MTTEERLEKLEVELAATKGALRRNRWATGVGVLAVLGSLTMAAVRDNEVIRAKKFVVVDDQGRTRMVLSALPKEIGPTLALFDEKGKLRAALNVNESGQPNLGLYDENGKTRVALDMTENGPLLRLSDGNDKPRVNLAAFDSDAGLQLSDENGKNRTALDVTDSGPRLQLSDTQEQPRVLAVVGTSGAGLELFDSTGLGRWGAPLGCCR